MPQQTPYRQSQYNPLGIESSEGLNIQVDSASYHEIKVYNGTRDALWQLLASLTYQNNLNEIVNIANEISIMLVRADSIWKSINENTEIKAQKIKIHKSSFKYLGQFMNYSKDITRYVNFVRKKEDFVNQYGEPESEFGQYNDLNLEGKTQFIKEKVLKIVSDADVEWGKLAASIGFGMPLKIAEESDMFFRGGS